MKASEISSYWPHKFTKLGNPKQIGEEKIMDNTYRPLMAQPMICVHCHIEFTQGESAPPPGPCPARTTKKELKRLIG
jgi:hypothetical protein